MLDVKRRSLRVEKSNKMYNIDYKSNRLSLNVPPKIHLDKIPESEKYEGGNNGNDGEMNKNSSFKNISSKDYTVKNSNQKHPDYVFAGDGLIAYLPDKLSLLLKEAIYQFNLKPNVAKDFLITKKIISKNSPKEFGNFIFQNSNIHQSKLSKKRIGEFVGSFHSYNQEVLDYFLAKFDFSGPFCRCV